MSAITSGAHAVVAALSDHGIDTVFGIPGTHNLEIYRHLAAGGIRHVGTRHEQGAGYAADAYARVTGRPGVVLTTSGPGLTNACTAAATAYADSIPLLLISPGVPRGMERADAGWLHEVKDQQAHLDALVDASIRVASPQQAYAAIAATMGRWQAGRPRPVHIEIPVDVLEEPFDPSTLPEPGYGSPASPPVADLAAVDAAVRILAESTSPILVVGGGASAAAAEVEQLALRLNAPVISTVNGKGVLPETHPLSLGAAIRLPAAHRIIEDADAVLVIGSELGDSDLWGHTLAPTGTVIRLDIDERQLDKNVRASAHLHGDAGTTLRSVCLALSDGSPRRGDGSASALREACDRDALREGEPFLAYHDALRQALPEDTIIAGDSAQVSYFGTVHQWPCLRSGQFLYPAGYATLGYGIPAGIGAAIAAPGTPVVVLAGDGGTLFTIQEFLTATELWLGLPVVVMNNGGYGEIRDEMDQREIPRTAVDLLSPDFVALGRALGGAGVRVEDPDAVAREVVLALRRDCPTLIEVPMAGPH